MLSPEQAKIHTFDVTPTLPDNLKPLRDIANNLWWTWHPEAVEMFVRLDRTLWHQSHHNPIALLGSVAQQRLEDASKDDGYVSSLERVMESFNRHLNRRPWHDQIEGVNDKMSIAYFCSEFGLTESLQIYSGGLGCLAGDHLKSASELGLPFVAVGLLYRQGYFQQYLNAEGWQQEYYPELDFHNLPTNKVRGEDGKQLRVSVDMLGREVQIGIWKVDVGKVPLYLLDTNLPENAPEDRGITDKLYGGDMEHRIRQEIVLGIGGMRALELMGIKPNVFHMNEGHSAFLALERIRKIIEKHNVNFDEAREAAAPGHVFTTHTPVPAGIDRFPPDLVSRYLKSMLETLRLDMEGLLALGRENVYNKNEFFSMAVLAIRTSQWANGVSKLHGEVSRDMWQNIWPGMPHDEVPIGHVTNGVHARSWLSGDLTFLFDRYLGNRWQADPVDHKVWNAVYDMPDEELWRTHERRRQRLIVWARRSLREQLQRRGVDPDEINEQVEALDPNALTIGFARRFATYKRGNLILRNPDRLLAMLADTEKPVQFIIAGKSHPADGGGKDLIRQIVQFAAEHEAGHRIVFIENYDISVARYLVQGCDIWLNNPRRGMEASGTSGMKAALNGVLNCSIMDGWWDEAYEHDLGWQIGQGEDYANPEAADEVESQALYDLLEKQIIATFYDRDHHGIPRRWVSKMKACISKLAPMFNTNRMVQEYAEKFYIPAANRSLLLYGDNIDKAIEVTTKKARLRANWSKLAVEQVKAEIGETVGVHTTFDVEAVVNLAGLKLDDVRVQVYVGRQNNDRKIVDGQPVDMKQVEDLGSGRYRFRGEVPTANSGRHGFAVRILPGGPIMSHMTEPGLIFWDKGDGRGVTSTSTEPAKASVA